MYTISTLSLSHTHAAYVTIHIHTQDWLHTFKNPYTPSILETHTHRTSSLSTIPRNRGCHRHLHTHTHTQPIIIPPINHRVTSGNHRASYRYTQCLLLMSSVSHRLWPPPYSNTHFFLCSGGSNRVASPKSPIFSSMFSVIKKFPEQGRRSVSDAFFSASPTPHPVGPGVSPSLRSRCKMPRWCKYLSPERICRR